MCKNTSKSINRTNQESECLESLCPEFLILTVKNSELEEPPLHVDMTCVHIDLGHLHISILSMHAQQL